MRRFAPAQPDLFAPAPAPVAPPPPEPPPLQQLTQMLALVRGAADMPWPTLSAVLEQEHRALHWASRSGPEGEALRLAIEDEIERIFHTHEQAGLAQSAAFGRAAPGGDEPNV